MAKANSTEQYRAAWNAHVQEMAQVALAAGVNYDYWLSLKTSLENLVAEAALRSFEQGEDA